MNLLAINVGNTRVQFAVFVDGQMQLMHHVAHDQSDAFCDELDEAARPLRETGEVAIYMASTNAVAAKRIAADVKSVTGSPVLRIEQDVAVPIGRQLDPETIVGEDRLLNCAAAFDQRRQACIVIDAGTAVTVDFVDGEGTFHGGAILPGAKLMLAAMHEHTAQLPQISMTQPREAIGRNTAEAMLSGVYHGLRGAVRELCEQYAAYYGAYPAIIATGGDSDLLFGDYDLVEARVPELTLMGMCVTHRHHLEANE